MPAPRFPASRRSAPFGGAAWYRERLRTNLWLVPTVEALLFALLFAATITLDRLAYDGRFSLADWVLSGTADSARQILTTIAAALITVVGLVFSITIVALTLASTQFGPRMLRTFIRDRGTQLTLGTFVATFFYTVLVLVAISPGPHGDFVPHLSITLALGFTVVDLGVLIYFIHHIATMIQLPQVIAVIADDLARAIEAHGGTDQPPSTSADGGPGTEDLLRLVEDLGTVIPTPTTGYLQFLNHDELVRLATAADAVLHLPYRPGHFLVQGQPLAVVWPSAAAPRLAAQLARAQVTGPYRTLTQDVSFGFDQLVEIAIRALSPAVNDTFTALTCIDWLSHCLCRITHGWHPQHAHRDRSGRIRVIAYQADYDRLVQRAFEKIRQCSAGMPAVMIRQLDALCRVMEQTTIPRRRQVLMDQGAMIWRTCEASVPEPADREDVLRRYTTLLALHRAAEALPEAAVEAAAEAAAEAAVAHLGPPHA
ncbi:DUF2254 domain-containing protein [Kitasatospora sp. NBC_01287]|uniref:DUF2254 domain-containing protein n=1 Tax=Kitasatospora sp. NBC_01287 TaxID=2903573 RepID=UPI00224DB6CE|nr:DUF2254 domain-containing protein [Kitasatospora sp. NBC_01287]MCX4750517.1 DUF2254 domain-containing protein [Kitasatospora sp. NBC_01287]